jgi:hypothetical protein
MMQMENKLFNFFAYLLITVQAILLMFMSMHIHNIDNNIDSLRADNHKLRQELIETEERCKRLTDSCIYILSEGVWE